MSDHWHNIEWQKKYGSPGNVLDRFGDTLVKGWVDGVPVEENVWDQVRNLASVPGVERIAVMPDAHLGNGACVGSAILTRDVVIPAAVGVDIGCGMIAAPLNLTVADIQPYLHQIRLEIEKRVPVGRTNNGGPGDRGAWHDIPEDVQAAWETVEQPYMEMIYKYPTLTFTREVSQFGTLGTGNHFIEVQYDAEYPGKEIVDESPVWIMLHSGSRGIGNRIGTTFTKWARKEMERWHIELPDPELAFLPVDTELGQDYLKYVKWAQSYAWESRRLMWSATLDAIGEVIGDIHIRPTQEPIHVFHNYVAHERHFGKPGLLTRKGAINAALGQLGIIPSSMGGYSFITSGLGNPEALMTSSHGAGRTMSRTAIKKLVSLEQFKQEVAGVECRADERDAPIDEAPSAYKMIESVMEAQKELTEPVTKLKALISVKG